MRGVRGLSRVAVSVAAVVAALGLCVPSAVADEALPTDWYVDDTGVRDAWAQGVTGEGVKVAVIDDRVVSDYPGFADADVSYKAVLNGGARSCSVEDGSMSLSVDDPTVDSSKGYYASHGTDMVALLVGNGKGFDESRGVIGVAPKATVTAYPTGLTRKGDVGGLNSPLPCKGKDGHGVIDNANTLQYAVSDSARIINMAYITPLFLTGSQTMPYLSALRHGVVLIAARDNTTVAGARDFVGKPASNNYFPGEVTVNAVGRDGSLAKASDVMDGNVAVLAPGERISSYTKTDQRSLPVNGASGTSGATAVLSGYLALVMSKWPEATGNQVLQSLVRNTKGNDTGEARLDPEHKRGFGEVDLRKLLAVDPTRYPDVNPILQWQVEASERHEETKGMYQDHSDWPEYSTGETDPFDGDDGERTIRVPKEAELVGRELDRQLKAWEKVESCRADGGSDCMRYSATNTADQADESSPLPDTGSDAGSSGSRATLPSWLPWAVGGGVAVLVLVAGGVVLAVVASRRRRRGRHGGDGNGHGPAAPPMPPARPMPPVAPVPPASPVQSAYPVSPVSGPVFPSFGASYGDGGRQVNGSPVGSMSAPGSVQAGPASVANPPYASRSAYPPVDAASVVSSDHAQQSTANRQRQPNYKQR